MRVALQRVVHPCGALPPASLPRLCRSVRHVRCEARRTRRLSICRATPYEEFEQTRLEQFGEENDAEISPEEWESVQYVADRLFPEGQVDWDGLWTGESYTEWHAQWQELQQELGTTLPLP